MADQNEEKSKKHEAQRRATMPVTTTATLTYLDRSDVFFRDQGSEKPYMVRFPVDNISGAKQTNMSFKPVSGITITDVGQLGAESFTLDRCGFELAKFESKFHLKDFKTAESFRQIQNPFFEEVEAWLVDQKGATWAETYTCDIRRREKTYPAVQFSEHAQPLRAVHVDHSRLDAEEIINSKLKKRNENRLGRAQLLTVWKPLCDIVQDWPLALCDFRSVDEANDITEVDLVFPSTVREGYNVFRNRHHQWYFLSDQRANEVWLLKSYDSKDDVAKYSPHAAFEWAQAPVDRKARESIEVRVLLYFAEEDRP